MKQKCFSWTLNVRVVSKSPQLGKCKNESSYFTMTVMDHTGTLARYVLFGSAADKVFDLVKEDDVAEIKLENTNNLIIFTSYKLF